MQYYYLQPALPGETGRNTVFDNSVHPPIIHKLEYVLDDIPEDVLFTSWPAYVISEEAKQALIKSGFTGMSFDEVEISKSYIYEENHGSKSPGKFSMLRIEGEAGRDDFGIGSEWRLVISERALDLLDNLGLPNATAEPVKG
jgi:hypothetical protein